MAVSYQIINIMSVRDAYDVSVTLNQKIVGNISLIAHAA